MAPEQMTGGRATSKSDIYGFGMTIYEIFTGLAPFAHLPNDLVHAYVTKEDRRPERPSDLDVVVHGLDDSMWDIVLECWCRESSARPRAVDLVRRLDLLATLYAEQQKFPLSGHAGEDSEPVITQDTTSQQSNRGNLGSSVDAWGKTLRQLTTIDYPTVSHW
ncbi:hypothetical protein JAAARDRAFT_698226 [Jaapia argillacea MUCL 33604]|uniref:Protein kinase domain-containing protein n=1 Tax=Jaapia argillacea MUCL 33604 TaxID=933084 RepID=A0A067PFU2_9AGAM|nr:hypothetical protein JAAARDRAFT_698226 [Jaapia argillacea MUCL 33604]